jgi:predicted TIM-barrel fold metal-dependent hydrolase
MIDSHVHIGQFYETWYDPSLVVKTVLEAGVEKVAISSTTSCAEEVKYAEIEKEIAGLFEKENYSPEKVTPFLWYVPEYANQGLTVEKAMQTLPYKGIKIHPRANNWDMENPKPAALLEELFGYANQHELPVIIHTGPDKVDEANKFSKYFPLYPKAKFILAHCRPPDQTLQLLLQNPNVYCDTAFVEKDLVNFFFLRGLRHKVVLGSDFPITHYYNKNNTSSDRSFVTALKDQYACDFERLYLYGEIIHWGKYGDKV